MPPAFGPWPRAALAAGGVAGLVLVLFYYWFVVADRYSVFLYEHLGATPFDAVTRSRYWMAGLVAAGAVLVLYAGANWGIGRIAALRRRSYTPPSWPRVWLLAALFLIPGILWISTTQNAPTLPFGLALIVVLATLAGLALALWPGLWAAEQPVALIWLAADGVGVTVVLQLLWAVELPGRGLSSPVIGWTVGLGSLLASACWLGVMTGLRRWRGRPSPGPAMVLAAGFSICYLLLPLAHHLFATPVGYRYITTAGNFFASSWGLQMIVWAAAIGLVLGMHRLAGR